MSNLKEFMRAAFEQQSNPGERKIVVFGDPVPDEVMESVDGHDSLIFTAESQQQELELFQQKTKICILNAHGSSIGRIDREVIEELRDVENLAFVILKGDKLTEQQLHNVEHVKALLVEAEVPVYDTLPEAIEDLAQDG